MNYRLMAIDIDGTLLDDRKRMSDENKNAVNAALDQGMIIALCSGRSVAELLDFFPVFPKMRYVITENGAGVYDLKAGEYILHHYLEPEYLIKAFDVAKGRDILIQLMMGLTNVVSKEAAKHLGRYRIEQYREHYERTARFEDDPYRYCKENDWKAGKICLYHTDGEEREKSRKLLSGFPVSMVDAEETSLEITSEGVNKGSGLLALCEHLDIPRSATIAIGDSYNDIGMLEMAGLPVAMGNAVDQVKEISTVTVADCNHSGVAEAIRRYLL